jgi:hypothetical protein
MQRLRRHAWIWEESSADGWNGRERGPRRAPKARAIEWKYSFNKNIFTEKIKSRNTFHKRKTSTQQLLKLTSGSSLFSISSGSILLFAISMSAFVSLCRSCNTSNSSFTTTNGCTIELQCNIYRFISTLTCTLLTMRGTESIRGWQ